MEECPVDIKDITINQGNIKETSAAEVNIKSSLNEVISNEHSNMTLVSKQNAAPPRFVEAENVFKRIKSTKTHSVSFRTVLLISIVIFILTFIVGFFIGRATVSNTPDEISDSPSKHEGTFDTVSSTTSIATSLCECTSMSISPTSLSSVVNSFMDTSNLGIVSSRSSPPFTSSTIYLTSSSSLPSVQTNATSDLTVTLPSRVNSVTETDLLSSTLFTESICSGQQTVTEYMYTTISFSCPTPVVSSDDTVVSMTDLPTTTRQSIDATICINPSPTISMSSTTLLSSITETSNDTNTHCYNCPTRDPFSTSEDIIAEVTPFQQLSESEVLKVMNVVKSRGYATYTQNFGENRISQVYLDRGNKTEILNYLDNNGSLPWRNAIVHVVRPTATPPDVMLYRVGPVNVTDVDMTVEQLLPDGEISLTRKTCDSREKRELYKFIEPNVEAIDQLLKESFDNATYLNGIFASFDIIPADDITDRVSHMVLGIAMSGDPALRLLPVSCKVHHPGENVSNWFTSDWFYLSQGPFNTSEDLQLAFNNGVLQKISYPFGYRSNHNDELNHQRNDSLPPRDFDHMPPPRTYEPEGPRYSINGMRIKWMGWDFEFSSESTRGPSIFNVIFLQERIAYEISLQDITLMYHPGTNGHGPLVLSDITYLIGAFMKPRQELDCPSRASILNTTVFYEGYPYELESACVFEADGQRALWRHENRGLADHYLVLRTVSTVGNYDYTVEWNFHLDGKVQTLLTASGYLYGAFWEPGDLSSTPFGYRVLDYLSGPIHDHNYAFKVDLDILGRSNSFQTIHWKNGESLEAFKTYSNNVTEKPVFFYFNHTRYVEHEIVENETSFIVDSKTPKYWTVVNENEFNDWGVKRGYRVIPHSPAAEILQEHPMLHGWNALKYHISVSKQKDSEQYATNSHYILSHPTSSFPKINAVELDNETIRKEDIVVWINEKFLHLPSAEDIPVTLSVPRGFTIKPFNYFDKTPVFDIPAHYSETESPYTFHQCYENV